MRYASLLPYGLALCLLGSLLSCNAGSPLPADAPPAEQAAPLAPDAHYHKPAADRGSAVKTVVGDSLPPQDWKKQRERIFERIRYHDDGIYENYKIEFWDEESKTLSKQIRLMDLDPFAELRQLPYTKDVGDVEFDLTRAGQEKLRQYMQAKRYPQWLLEKEVVSAFLGIRIDRLSKDKKNITFVYYLMLYSPSGKAITKLAEYRIYDEKGKEIGNFSDYRGGYTPVASRDGKWMAVGIEEFDEEADIEDMGNFSLLFYDVDTGQPVYQDTKDADPLIFAVHDYFVSTGGTLFNVYYLDKMLKYQKEFPSIFKRPGVIEPEDYESDGVFETIYVPNPEGGFIRTTRKRFYFEKDFEVSPLKRIK